MANRFWPLFDLAVRTPRLELRYPDDEMLSDLMAVAAQGVHDPDYMPFEIPWTDAKSPELEQRGLQFFWSARGSLSADEWQLPMAVVVDGSVCGVQSVGAEKFPARRVVSTGSWLGRGFQGRGIGKEMRAAVLHLAFAGLGAERAESAAWDDNHSSIGVSTALGYAENGDRIKLRRGEPRRQIQFRMSRADWERRRRDDIEIVALDPCLPLLGL